VGGGGGDDEGLPGDGGVGAWALRWLVCYQKGRSITDLSLYLKGSLSGGGYAPLSNGSAPVDTGAERVVIDQSAGGESKFYRVEITR